MRKRMAILLACLLFLSGCGQEQTAREKVSSTSGTVQGDEENIGEGFEMVSSTDYNNYGCGTEDGFYSVVSNEDQSKNLMYIDYASKKQVYLCDQPNCTHDSEQCNSWIAPCGGTVVPVVWQDCLFLIFNSIGQCKVVRMDVSGHNRETFFIFETVTSVENAMAANDRYLIFSVRQSVQDGSEVKSVSKLIALDLMQAQMREVFSVEQLEETKQTESCYMTFKGVSDAGFIVEIIQQEPYEENTNDVEPNPQIGHRIYHIPFSGEKEEQIAAYSNQEAQCAVYGDSLYYVESQSGRGLCLFRINPQTKERKLLAEHLAAEPSSTASEPLPEDVVFRNLVDDWLIMNILTKEYIAENKNIELVFTGVAVNTASGESRKISLTNYFNATTAPIEILAQTRENLLVYSDTQPRKEDPLHVGLLAREIGLISKEDYLASIPNYQPIELLRTDS